MLTMLITLIIVGTATLWDISTRRIPNFVTLPAIVLGLIFNTYYSGLTGLGDALIGLVVGILLLLIPFTLGGMGAGDVKILAAIGALNGTSVVFHTFLYSAIAGGVVALVVALLRKQLFPVLSNIFWALHNLFTRGKGQPLMPVTSGIRFPYGIAIFIGTITTYWLG